MNTDTSIGMALAQADVTSEGQDTDQDTEVTEQPKRQRKAKAEAPAETAEQTIARLQAELGGARQALANDRSSGKVGLGANISHTLKGTILTLTIDLAKSQGKSKSGNSILVASTGGNQALGDVRVGVNVFRPISR